MSIIVQLLGSVAVWWSSWREAVAKDQADRRKVKTIEDRLEGCEPIKRVVIFDTKRGVYISKTFLKAPEADIMLMVTKEYKV